MKVSEAITNAQAFIKTQEDPAVLMAISGAFWTAIVL
jgi:hypothetical protein